MSDIPINTSSFNQAYRAYAIEQGNDPKQGQLKAKDVANQNASSAILAMEDAVDAAYVSPEASRLYAAQLRQRRKVNEAKHTEASHRAYSGTAESALESDDRIEAAPDEQQDNQEK